MNFLIIFVSLNYDKNTHMGVCYIKPNKKTIIKNNNIIEFWSNPKWTASFEIGKRKAIRLGYFKTEIEAAIAYNNSVIKYRGNFAKLNIIEPQT